MSKSKLAESARFSILRSTLESLSKHIHDVGQYMKLHEPRQYELYLQGLQRTDEILKSIDVSRHTTLTEIVDIYTKAAEAVSVMDRLVDIYANPYYIDMLSTGLSQGHRERLEFIKRAALREREIYREICAKEDPQIFADMADVLRLDENFDSVVAKLAEYHEASPLIVYLLKRLTEIRADDKRLMNVIQSFRKAAVHAPMDMHLNGEFTHPAEWFTTSLMPCTPYQEVDLDSLGMHVAIIDKDIGREIDYNYLTILDADYIKANDLFVKATSGINKRIHRKMDVIQDIERSKTSEPLLRRIGERTPTAVLLEHRGGLYRRLGVNFGDQTVDIQLIDALEHRSRERQALGDIEEYYIFNRAGDSRARAFVRQYEEHKSTFAPTESLMKALITDLVEGFDITIDVAGDELMQRFIQFVNQSWQAKFMTQLARYAGGSSSVEGKVSFVMKLVDMREDFRKMLASSVRRLVNPAQFAQRSDMSTHLKQLYRDVVTDAVNGMDVAPSKWKGVEPTLKDYYLRQKYAM